MPFSNIRNHLDMLYLLGNIVAKSTVFIYVNTKILLLSS
jgi:hypothetical protein